MISQAKYRQPRPKPTQVVIMSDEEQLGVSTLQNSSEFIKIVQWMSDLYIQCCVKNVIYISNNKIKSIDGMRMILNTI